MKVAWLDTETTGKDPVKNDVIQVAMLIEIDGRIVDEFKGVCQPHDFGSIEAEALAVHGMTVDQLKTFPDPRKLHGQIEKIFARFINKYDRADKFTLAGMKPDFDAQFMKEFFMKCGDQWWGSWCNWRHIDLLALVRILRYAGTLELENDKLATICAKLGIELQAHDALSDIVAKRKAVHELMARHFRPAGKVDSSEGPFALFGGQLVNADLLEREQEELRFNQEQAAAQDAPKE